jgi:hypothetical protein
MSTATVAPLPCSPARQLRIVETSTLTSAADEFALLETWLASSPALQLPLHQIECQQQERGREVQRLLLQAHLEHRGQGDVGPALCVQREDGEELRHTHRRLGTRSLQTVFGTYKSSAWASPGRAHPASIPSTRPSFCPPARFPTNYSGD